jgi:hypothetical protein
MAAVLPLAACLEPGAGGQAGLTGAASGPAPSSAQAGVKLSGGNVVVAGPAGYCIDSQEVSDRLTGSFALLASCEVLSNGRAGPAVEPAIMTVTILPRRANTTVPTAQAMGDAMFPAKVLTSREEGGLTVVQLASGGEQISRAGDPRHWRAAIVINGHLIALAVYGPKGSKVAGRQGLAMIVALADAIRRASPARDGA